MAQQTLRATKNWVMKDADLSGSIVDGIDLSRTTFNQIDFPSASVNGSNMADEQANDVYRSGAKVETTDLSGLEITDCGMPLKNPTINRLSVYESVEI